MRRSSDPVKRSDPAMRRPRCLDTYATRVWSCDTSVVKGCRGAPAGVAICRRTGVSIPPSPVRRSGRAGTIGPGATSNRSITMSSSPIISTRHTRILWAIQIVLAALFIVAGGMKEATPAAALARLAPLPVAFLRFIGLAEILGALGLVLPGALGVL